MTQTVTDDLTDFLADLARETVRRGKGAKHRTVPLNADVRHALGVYLAVRPRTGDDHLFLGQRGRGLSEQAVWYQVTKYARQAGLEDVSPHTLRHSFGKQLLDATKDLVAVAALLGHEKGDRKSTRLNSSHANI